MGGSKGNRKTGFYRRALAKDEELGEGKVDVGEIKRRLIAEMRRRPGEMHLLLQGSKVVLRAAALEDRMSAKSGKELAESVDAVLRKYEAELGPGSG